MARKMLLQVFTSARPWTVHRARDRPQTPQTPDILLDGLSTSHSGTIFHYVGFVVTI